VTLEFAKKELAERTEAGLKRTIQELSSSTGRLISIDNKSFLNFSSNNYLSLASDKRLIEAANSALERYGVGSGASRLITGTTAPHRELEERISSFMGASKERASILFNSGYHANIGVIPALVGRGDMIFADRLNHASLIDGAILSRAKIKRYPHRDMDSLEAMLKEANSVNSTQNARKLIITDGIFSMNGTISPLNDILELSHRYGALVYIDDAHGVGVLGESGRGTLEHLNLKPTENVIEMGTFGKAFGTFGAFINAPKLIIELLGQKARSFIYTTALPPAIAAATVKAIEIVENEPERREKLNINARKLRDGLKSFSTPEAVSHIIPVITGKADKAMALSKSLYEEGFFVQAIRPPTVPRGLSMLRVTAMSEHTDADINGLVAIIQKNLDGK
jgi:glycine C-acetyltransferase